MRAKTLAAPSQFGHEHLLRGLELVGGDFHFSKLVTDDEPLLTGPTFYIRSLQPGLVLHCAQVRDLKDFSTQVLQQPGIKLTLLTAGATQLAYGRRHYHLGPQARPDARNHAALVALAEPDTFRRQWRRGREERKISLTLKPEWLEQTGLGQFGGQPLAEFAAEHMAERSWLPSTQAVLAAERILQPPPLLPALRDLFVQARCLDIVTEALGIIACQSACESSTPRQRQRIARLRELLDSGAADNWSLQYIASQMGSNPTSLQRAFRAETGLTIFDYQRRRRMQHAYLILRRDAASVERAAALAGYGSATNFATAFKRIYGITPRAARRS